jgi:hypothetical protein
MADQIADTIRRAVEHSDRLPVEIARAADVAPSQLSRFMAGQPLKLPAVERLCKVLGLELRPVKQLKRKGKA